MSIVAGKHLEETLKIIMSVQWRSICITQLLNMEGITVIVDRVVTR